MAIFKDIFAVCLFVIFYLCPATCGPKGHGSWRFVIYIFSMIMNIIPDRRHPQQPLSYHTALVGIPCLLLPKAYIYLQLSRCFKQIQSD